MYISRAMPWQVLEQLETYHLEATPSARPSPVSICQNLTYPNLLPSGVILSSIRQLSVVTSLGNLTQKKMGINPMGQALSQGWLAKR